VSDILDFGLGDTRIYEVRPESKFRFLFLSRQRCVIAIMGLLAIISLTIVGKIIKTVSRLVGIVYATWRVFENG